MELKKLISFDMALIVEFYLKTYYCSVGVLTVLLVELVELVELLVFNGVVVVFVLFVVEVLAPIKR